MFQSFRRFLSRPFPMALLAWAFVFSLLLPTAEASWESPELDGLNQLYSEVFATTIEEGMPVELLGPIEGAGIQFLISPDGSIRIYEILSAVDITSTVQEELEAQGDSLLPGDHLWSTMGWLETTSEGVTVAVSALVRCSELEGNWLFLTSTVPESFLQRIAENAATLTTLAEQSSESVHFAAPTLQPFGIAAVEENLHNVATNLRNIVEAEGDVAALEQAGAFQTQTDADEDLCLATLVASNNNALAALNAAIDTADSDLASALDSADLTWTLSVAGATAALALCIAAATAGTWGFGIPACLIAYDAAITAFDIILENALSSANAAHALAIANAWNIYNTAMQGARDVYNACMQSVKDARQLEYSTILDSISQVSKSAILAASLEAKLIYETYSKTGLFEDSNYEVIDGVLLSWPTECFE